MASRLLDALLRGLTGSPSDKTTERKVATSPRSGEISTAAKPAAGGDLPADEIEQRLARMLGEANSLRPGQIIFLDVKKLADRFGGKWPSVAERAETIICQTIEKHQQPGDGYKRLERLTYLLMFSDKAPGHAEAEAVRIVTEFAEKVIGTSWTPDLFTLRTVFGSPPDALEVKRIPIPDRATSLLAPVVRKFNEAKDSSQDSSANDPLSAVTVIYRPMWDVKHGALSTYLATPALKSQDKNARSSEADFLGTGNPELKAKLDAAVAKRAAVDIGSFLDTAGKILVGIQVHFDTLAASNRRIEFLRACASVPAGARHLVVFELLGSPPGVPASRLQDVCAELKPYSRAIIACVPIETRDFTPYRIAGFQAVGLELASNRNPEQAVIEQMQQFAAAADKARLPCFVHGLRSTSLASSAAAAGFRYIDGQSVHSIVEGLQQLRRYGAADLYASVFSGSKQVETAP